MTQKESLIILGVKAYREANDLTWHEENNLKSMDLMPSDINGRLGHLV